MTYKIIISGCCGHMGKVVEEICTSDPDIEIAAGFDVISEKRSFPIFSSPADFSGQADAVIDFSNPAALDGLLDFAEKRNIPLVLATTGYSEVQLKKIEAASQKVAIFRSANMSLGINVLLELVKKASAVLGDSYDIEIVEKHHNRKLDAPSGTALMIADAASAARKSESSYVYERHSVRAPRDKQEIGISSVRGGTIVGVHEILFAGRDETIEIKHTAMSREIFANGAVKAAKFIANVAQPGMYDMSMLISAN